jgi:hypothetical protein
VAVGQAPAVEARQIRFHNVLDDLGIGEPDAHQRDDGGEGGWIAVAFGRGFDGGAAEVEGLGVGRVSGWVP